MSSGQLDSHKRIKDRVDLNRSVRLRFDKFQDFLTEIAGNISPSGMFVRSSDPPEPGECFDFECSLADGYPLVSGRAEVVWVRTASTSEKQPTGMGVRFVALRDKSDVLIRRIVEQRIEAGEETFELEGESLAAEAEDPDPEGPDVESLDLVPEPPLEFESVPRQNTQARAVSPEPIPASLSEPEPAPARVPERLQLTETALNTSLFPDSVSRAARKRSTRDRIGLGRFLELVLFSLLAGVCMVLIFNQYWVRPRIEGLEAKLGELTGSSRVGGPPGFSRAIEAEKAEDQPKDESPLVAEVPPQRLVRTTVRNWARAWSERRVDDYLSFYSENFVPASGATREQWEARRRDRLLKQGIISVSVVSLEVEEVSATEMRVAFTQSYRSDRFHDRVRKNLRMVWVDAAWKIAEEAVVRKMPW